MAKPSKPGKLTLVSSVADEDEEPWVVAAFDMLRRADRLSRNTCAEHGTHPIGACPENAKGGD